MERSLLLCNFKFFVEISKKSVFPLENVSKSQLWAIRKKLFLSSIFSSNIPFGEISIFVRFFENMKKGNRQAKHVKSTIEFPCLDIRYFKRSGFLWNFQCTGQFLSIYRRKHAQFSIFQFFFLCVIVVEIRWIMQENCIDDSLAND